MKKHHLITAIVAGTIALIGTGNLLAEKKAKGEGKGRPSREEMHKKMLEKFDADGDGKLNEAEREKAHAAMKKRGAERFAKADKNGDGKLSQDEVPEKMWQHISKADKDDDGAVSKDEMAAMHKARAGKGKKGGGDNNQGKGKKPKKPAES
jgi:Ca2+-binding EF-hand superfamily protein